jgi:hypothetical protein
MLGDTDSYGVLMKKSLERSRRLEDNFKTDLRVMSYEDDRWMELAQDGVH